MKIDIILTDRPNNVCRDLGREASNYDLSGKDYIAQMTDMCGEYLKICGHLHIFYSLVQLLLWIKASSALSE